MEYLIGVLLAAAVVAAAATIGLDRDRAFYPTVLMVIASYYILFAVMAGPGSTIAAESTAAGVFFLIAAIGFKKNLWLVAAAMAGHGVFDFVHHLVIQNPGVPPWWPGFCLAFDGVAGLWLAARLKARST